VIWAVLALLGVPLWLCAVGILALVVRSRKLRSRPGDIPVRVQRPGKKRWTRAHALWVSDVFVWRASPAAWSEDVRQVSAVSPRTATPEEHKKLHRLGDELALVTMAHADGVHLDVAAASGTRAALLGPFSSEKTPSRPVGAGDSA
jgi:hypothetical protein